MRVYSIADKEPEGVTASRALLTAQQTAWNKGDLEGFMAGYWKSAELRFYSGRDVQKGWQATYDRYKARYQSGDQDMGQLSFTDLVLDPLGADAVLVRGRWKLVRKKDTPDGLFTLLVRKLPEGWRIVHDHTSAGEPAKKP